MPGMNWAIPSAPADETARGLNPDSAISCAASSPGDTFQRAAERSSGSRNGPGTKLGTPELRASPSPSPGDPAGPTALPTSEQGGGPATYPKCQASQAYSEYREGGLALPPITVPV